MISTPGFRYFTLVIISALFICFGATFAQAAKPEKMKVPPGHAVRDNAHQRICSRLRMSIERRPYTFLKLPPFCDDAEEEVPEVDLSALPPSVLAGATTTLSWTSMRADSCNASGGWSGAKSLNGNEIVTVNATTTYTLTCANDENNASDSVTVNITPPPQPPPPPPPPPTPDLEFSASPTLVMKDATSTLTWDSTNTTSCVASNGWSGSKALDGNEIVTVHATSTYTLACGNGTATSTKSATVDVIVPPAPELELDASPDTVTIGATSTLMWNSSNATHCDASGAWNGMKSLDGNEIVTVNATSTYTLACGNGTSTSTKSVTVNAVPLPPPIVDVSANPLNIVSGATSTLTWSSMHAESCTASNGWSGAKALSGNEIVSPAATTTYSLSCFGNSATTTNSTTVSVFPASTTVNHVLISEVYYDTDASHGVEPSNEWIELYNPTASVIDLSGWTIWDSATSSHDTLPFGTSIATGGFLFITPTSATSTSSFWSIPSTTPIVVVSGASLGSNGLANAGDAVRLLDNATTTIDAMSYGTNISIFDPSVAATSTSGRSLYRTNLATDTDSASDWGILITPTPGSF